MAVDIYDITGRLVKTIFHSPLGPGYYSFTWDITENRIENGVYLLSVLTDNGTETKMIDVLK